MSLKNTLVGLLGAVALTVFFPALGHLVVLFARWCGDPFFQEDNFDSLGSVGEVLGLACLGLGFSALILIVLMCIPHIVKALDRFGDFILSLGRPQDR